MQAAPAAASLLILNGLVATLAVNPSSPAGSPNNLLLPTAAGTTSLKSSFGKLSATLSLVVVDTYQVRGGSSFFFSLIILPASQPCAPLPSPSNHTQQ